MAALVHAQHAIVERLRASLVGSRAFTEETSGVETTGEDEKPYRPVVRYRYEIDGKEFEYDTNDRLRRALELKLFEDQKDSIKLTSLVSSVVDRDTQEKIDVVKGRLIANYGYCEHCATDVLNFVASIFARGDTKPTS